ncbi:MAG: hypothetical protein JWM90_559 [Thermoleophilia bacterium]|nr:hypothetical protein [Thermoleophilia bacterium]
MPHPFAYRTFDDDPDVRGTVARLRASVLAVICGTGAFIVLGLFAANLAWHSGIERGSTTGVTEAGNLPGSVVLGIVILGFALIGAVLFFTVRAPLQRARGHAIDLAEASRQLAESTLETFAALNAAVEAKDRYTAGHGLRVTLVSILIGQELGMNERELDVLRHAATFHDIGKIAVPDGVLQKPGRLTDEEFEAMKVHPIEGARICSKLQVLRDAVPLIRSHHERMDGRGYPDGLLSTQIPIGARIIAVADTWDAITSDRPYRRGQPAFVALEEVRRCAGAQFDERVVRAFIDVLAKDPWMFGLTPEDVTEGRRPLPAPLPASRGADSSGDGRRVVGQPDEPEIDWTTGFDKEDLAA